MTEEVRTNIIALAQGILDDFKGKAVATKDPESVEDNGTKGFYACKAALRKAFRKAGYRNIDCELTDRLRIYMQGEGRMVV